MNVVFMGTPEFAVPSLEILIKNHNVIAVVTQPDRPKGRGKKLLPPIIKTVAQNNNIPVYQPLKVKEPEFVNTLKSLNPDIIVVVAFGQILSVDILQIPKYGCVNVHGSLLPKYRGAAPIQWSIINGDKETGVTTMFMEKGLDSGDMLIKKYIDISPYETYGSLHDKMSIIGAEALKETLELIEKKEIKPEKQNDDDATFAPMITKEIEKIDWSKSASDIFSLIRGLSPQPGAYTIYNGETIKIWDADIISCDCGKVGEIVSVDKKGFAVKTSEGALYIKEIQAKGGKRMPSGDYMRGHSIEKGVVLGL